MHINEPILHLTVLLHFVLEQFFFVQHVVHYAWIVQFVVQDFIDIFTKNYVGRAVLLVPIDDQEVEAHTKDAVKYLHTVENFLNCLIVNVVMDQILVFVAFTRVFKDTLEVAVHYHGHGSVPISVTTVAVELMYRILKPSIALLLKPVPIHEYMIKNDTDLQKLKSVQEFAAIKFLVLENKLAFYNNYKYRKSCLGNQLRIDKWWVVLLIYKHLNELNEILEQNENVDQEYDEEAVVEGYSEFKARCFH